jgi:hypothetical protein
LPNAGAAFLLMKPASGEDAVGLYLLILKEDHIMLLTCKYLNFSALINPFSTEVGSENE